MAAKNQHSDGKGPEKAKTAVNALVTTFAILASVIGLNVIGNRTFGRVDLTQDHIYKLSQVSRDTVDQLPDRLNIKAFISGDLQAPLNTYGRYVRDLLDEYAAASHGKVSWEAIDPLEGKDADEKQKKKEDLGKYKIQKITLERVSDTKLEIGSENYLGIAFVYGEQIESIPQVGSTEGLEYQITGIIKRLVVSKKKKVGFVTSEGELTPQQGLQYLTRVLSDYETSAVTLDKAVADDIDALMVIGPKQPFSDKAKFFLDQFLMRGKPVAMFVDGMKMDTPRGMNVPGMEQPKIGQPNEVNLADLFAAYGVKVRDDLILDEQDTLGPVPVQGQMFLANYPTFIGIGEKGFTKDFDLTAHMTALVMPFSSSLELVGDVKDGKGTVTATPVAKTTLKSWRNSGFFIFNPTVKMQKPASEADKGPFVLGYALQGKFTSAYPNGMPGTTPGMSVPENDHLLKASPDGGRFLVMGSSGMLDDRQLPLQQAAIYRTNLLFAINAIDWLIHDDSLIALRVKGMGSRPLTVAYDGTVKLWVYLIELGIPVALILYGLLHSWRRSGRRAAASL